MRTLIILLLMCGVCYGQVDIKPDIPDDKDLTKEEQILVKDYLKGRIFKELQPAKNNYVDGYDRGTVEFNPKKGINMLGVEVFEASNYAFSKVTIPDGTTIKEVNFSQKNPHTEAINGKDLHFIDCNLKNIEIDPTWIIEGSLTIHCKWEQDGGEMVYYIEKDKKWVENYREETNPNYDYN